MSSPREPLHGRVGADTLHPGSHSQDEAQQKSIEDNAQQVTVQADAQQSHTEDDAQQSHTEDDAQQSHTEDDAQQSHTEDDAQQSHTEGGAQQSHTEDDAQQSHTEDDAQQSHTEDDAQQSHTEGGAQQSHTEGGAQQSHTEGGAQQSHTEGGAQQSHTEDDAQQSHTEDDAQQSHTEDDAQQSHTEDDAQQSHTEDDAQQSHTEDDAQQSHTEDDAQQSHTEDDAQQSHTEGGAQQSHTEGGAQQSHTEGGAQQSHTEDDTQERETENDAQQRGRVDNEPHTGTTTSNTLSYNDRYAASSYNRSRNFIVPDRGRYYVNSGPSGTGSYYEGGANGGRGGIYYESGASGSYYGNGASGSYYRNGASGSYYRNGASGSYRNGASYYGSSASDSGTLNSNIHGYSGRRTDPREQDFFIRRPGDVPPPGGGVLLRGSTQGRLYSLGSSLSSLNDNQSYSRVVPRSNTDSPTGHRDYDQVRSGVYQRGQQEVLREGESRVYDPGRLLQGRLQGQTGNENYTSREYITGVGRRQDRTSGQQVYIRPRESYYSQRGTQRNSDSIFLYRRPDSRASRVYGVPREVSLLMAALPRQETGPLPQRSLQSDHIYYPNNASRNSNWHSRHPFGSSPQEQGASNNGRWVLRRNSLLAPQNPPMMSGRDTLLPHLTVSPPQNNHPNNYPRRLITGQSHPSTTVQSSSHQDLRTSNFPQHSIRGHTLGRTEILGQTGLSNSWGHTQLPGYSSRGHVSKRESWSQTDPRLLQDLTTSPTEPQGDSKGSRGLGEPVEPRRRTQLRDDPRGYTELRSHVGLYESLEETGHAESQSPETRTPRSSQGPMASHTNTPRISKVPQSPQDHGYVTSSSPDSKSPLPQHTSFSSADSCCSRRHTSATTERPTVRQADTRNSQEPTSVPVFTPRILQEPLSSEAQILLRVLEAPEAHASIGSPRCSSKTPHVTKNIHGHSVNGRRVTCGCAHDPCCFVAGCHFDWLSAAVRRINWKFCKYSATCPSVHQRVM
ncbi:filaggrin-like [Homarus americanus]|uniref:filaggrin-like n=1 Tax=Homarus americanus TaxID=6706 RepID=UPI001C437F54|nr:filaggrin-like [Homarus americanus]